MYRFAFLLFVPVLQGFIFAKSGVQLLFTLYSTDVLLLFLILSIAAVRCNHSKVLNSKNLLTVKSGAFFKTEEKTLKNRRCSFLFTKSIFLGLFGAWRLRIFSSNIYSTAYIKAKDKTEILREITGETRHKIISSGIFRTLLMSASFSNALTGLLAAVPVIRRASVIIGARQTALVLEGTGIEGLLKFTGLPPLLSKVSSLLFLCFVIGFFTEFFSEYGLKFIKFREYFMVSKGLITKTEAIFGKKELRALVFRQSLLMFLLGFYSGEIVLNIKPKRKIHVLSAARRTACEDLQDEIFGKNKSKAQVIYPPKSAMWGFTYLPLLCLLFSSAVVIVFSENIVATAVGGGFSLVFAIWFLFRFFALLRSSLLVSENHLEIKYFSGMNFTRTLFTAENIASFELTQSIFQRISGRCNLKIKLKNALARKVMIKQLYLKDVIKIKPRLESGV